jgi:hypothetical protein
MSVKPKDKILTYEQARDLKWFCQNVVGVRQDMYSAIESVKSFDERIARLEKTCDLIEKFLGEKIESHFKPFEENFK